MPLFKIRESDLAQPVEFWRVQNSVEALLLFPTDPKAREQYLASRLHQFARFIAEEMGPNTTLTITMPPSLWLSDPDVAAAEALAPAVRRPEKAPPFNLSPQGLAGLVLIQAFNLQDIGEDDVSLTKSIDAITSLLRTNQVTLGSTKQNIREVWHKFRAVAHIAAAMTIGYKRYNGAQWFSNPILFVEFLRVANSMRVRGEAIRHKRAAEAILPPGEGWEFVIAPCAVLNRTGSKNSGPGLKF